jgi:hypothetical protein
LRAKAICISSFLILIGIAVGVGLPICFSEEPPQLLSLVDNPDGQWSVVLYAQRDQQGRCEVTAEILTAWGEAVPHSKIVIAITSADLASVKKQYHIHFLDIRTAVVGSRTLYKPHSIER